MAGPFDLVRVQRRRSRRRRLARRHPEQLHVFSFNHPAVAGHREAVTVLVRGTMGQDAAIPLAGAQARARMPGAFCTDISPCRRRGRRRRSMRSRRGSPPSRTSWRC